MTKAREHQPGGNLTELQLRVLRAMGDLGADDAHTPNRIGEGAGARTITGGGRPGRGAGHRTFGAAQQVIPVLTSLRRRGLIYLGPRDDGLPGSAYGLTEAGQNLLPHGGGAG